MLHILFIILKIIGIIIAVVLGLLVLLVLTVLLVPLRYRVDGKCVGTLDSIQGSIRFSWLFHLFAGYFIRENGENRWQVRVIWKKLNRPQSEETPETSVESEQEDSAGEEAEEIKEQETAEKENAKSTDVLTEEEKPAEVREKKSGKKKQKKSIAEKINAWFQKIKYTMTAICDKMKLLMKKKEKVSEFLNHEIHRNAFGKAVSEIKRLLRFLKPKKIQGRIHFGFEDPAATGKVLAGASMLYPFYGETFSLEPDFEEPVLEGELHIKGYVRGVYAAIVVFHLILNKDIRTTYQNIRKFQL